MDEIWVHFYDPKSKQQSIEWKHPEYSRPKEFCVLKSAGNILASVLRDGIHSLPGQEEHHTLLESITQHY